MTARLGASLLLLISFAVASSTMAQVKPEGRLRVADGVMQGLLLTKVQPTYPPLARAARIQGEVVLKVTLNKSGDVQGVNLVSGHPMLAPAAVEAVKQWKYKPFLLNGDPVDVETTVTVNFVLAPDAPATGTAGDAPNGAPGGQMGGVIGGIISSTPGDPAHSGTPQRVRISSGVAVGLLAKRVSPDYPATARAARIQGMVILKVNIDKEGNVYNLETVSGHPLLVPAAIDAVKQWKYTPYLLNGTPVEVETQVQVTFTLAGG